MSIKHLQEALELNFALLCTALRRVLQHKQVA